MVDIYKHVTVSDELIWPAKPMMHQSVALDNTGDLPADVDELVSNAHDDIWQAGFSQGFAEATIAAEAALATQHATLNQLIQSIPKAIADNRLDLTKDIADIVLTIVQSFFIAQQQDPKALSEQISQILKQLNDKQELELCLHPQDIALLQQSKLSIDVSMCKPLRIIADEQLRLGGCFIKSEHGVFDASIEHQINRLKQVLLQIQQDTHA